MCFDVDLHVLRPYRSLECIDSHYLHPTQSVSGTLLLTPVLTANTQRAEIHATLTAASDGNFRVTFGGEVMTDWEIRDTLLRDARFVLISLAIAIVMLLIGTRSPFLTLFGVVQIVVSFPLAYALYFVGGHSHITVIQFLAPFVILGIGLDDIFVFVGIYQSLRTYGERFSIEKRLAVAWTRASASMLATSATSAAAFAANIVSPVPAVRSLPSCTAPLQLMVALRRHALTVDTCDEPHHGQRVLTPPHRSAVTSKDCSISWGMTSMPCASSRCPREFGDLFLLCSDLTRLRKRPPPACRCASLGCCWRCL